MGINIVLIDFENVQPDSLCALEQNNFRIFVFVGASQEKIPFDIACTMQRMGANAEYVKIASQGKNALDFHIAFYIGKLAAQDPKIFFHIISKDSGFDCLVQHLRARKIYVSRSASIAEMPVFRPQQTAIVTPPPSPPEKSSPLPSVVKTEASSPPTAVAVVNPIKPVVTDATAKKEVAATSKNTVLDERVELVVKQLAKAVKSKRPGNTRTLANAIQAGFQNQLTVADVQAIINAMKKQGLFETAGGKIAYKGNW